MGPDGSLAGEQIICLLLLLLLPLMLSLCGFCCCHSLFVGSNITAAAVVVEGNVCHFVAVVPAMQMTLFAMEIVAVVPAVPMTFLPFEHAAVLPAMQSLCKPSEGWGP